MKKASYKQRVLRMLIALEALVLLFCVLMMLSTKQQVCEFFASTFARAWIFIFGNLLGWIPISFYELFLIVAILGAIALVVFVVVFLCKKQWKRLLSTAIVVALAVITFLNIYTATASFSYGRDGLPTEVYEQYNGDDLTYEQAVELATHFVERANEAYRMTEHDPDGNIVYPYTFNEISNLLAEEYKRLESKYFSPYTPHGKRIINKTIMSELHITGVFFAPFGEANVNGNETNLYMPQTLAHEMAHGKGVMREFEADLVSYYILLTCDNPYLYYGAVVKCMYSAISIVGLYPNSSETVTKLYQMIDSGISKERNNYSRFYGQFTLLDDIGEFFNDLYLKLNKQEEGTGSYFKPGEVTGTGQKDDDGKEIVQIINFSGTQNLLIKLYKEGRLY